MLTAALAQAPTDPVVNPRGVVNAFTLQPAPSVVGRGALIYINGLKLGPPEGVKAPGPPWPTELSDPAVQVLLNGKAIPLFSAAPERIVAQIPWEAPIGLARIVVRRGDASSRPAMLFVDRSRPAVRSAGDNGFGPVAGASSSGQSVTISATGLGPTEPRVDTGDAGPPDPPAQPRDDLRVYIGGMPANATATLSKDRVGEFDIRIDVPATAQPGDPIVVYAGNRAANFTTYQTAGGADVKFVPLPDGTPDLQDLTGSDLRGQYLVANGARDDNGCYPSVLFELSAPKATPLDGCLTAANKNAPTPFVAAVDGAGLAAFLGPPAGDAQSGVSSKVQLFDPAKPAPMTIDLGAAASLLSSAGGGDFATIVPGPPPRGLLIDGQTGEVREAGGGGGGGGGGAGGAFLPKVDLGDGLNHVLDYRAVGDNLFSVLVTDDADQPKKARVAVINRNNEVQATRDFPGGWVPIVATRQPDTRPGQGGGTLPGAAAAALARNRVATYFDAPLRNFYVLAKNADNSQHGLVLFAEEGDAQLLAFPDAWFVAACSPTLVMYTLELSRKLAVVGSNSSEIGLRNPCSGTGFLLLDLNARKVAAAPLPGQGQFNVARGASNDLNDFIYGSNTDPSKNNTADTLFVLDGVNASVTQLSLPPGITSFGPLLAEPVMNALIGTAQSDSSDAGFVYFDLEAMQVKMFPVPDGFARVALAGIFPTTRKLVARGLNRAGSQFLIYDLITNDLNVVPNPDGVAAVVSPPARGGQGGGGAARVPALQHVSAKSNSIAAMGYRADGKQAGVMVVRIP